MKYPNGQDYEIMYKRFFSRPVSELIDFAVLAPKSNVLDLCGGTGRLTNALLEVGHNVTYVDEATNTMLLPLPFNFPEKMIVDESVEQYLSYCNRNNIVFDAIFCQQAINYWFRSVDIEKIAGALKARGCFIFNTFREKPSCKPTIKKYDIAGKHYAEVYYSIGSVVHHVQTCEGYPPHLTAFDYISMAEFVDALSPWFDITGKTDGNTAFYRCQKKGR